MRINKIRAVPIDKIWEDIIDHKKKNKVFSDERIKLESHCRDIHWK